MKGKENVTSLKSRFSIYKAKRKNPKLIWIHAASVGESLIAISLVDQLRKSINNVDFLITTGTLSSANIINKWLPDGVYHEFPPLENLFIVKNFYQYWQPDLGIFLESELWPTLLSEGSDKCKLLLLNARLSDKSFRKWQNFPKIFALLTNFFTYIAAQSEIDLKKYRTLGANNITNLDNLKFVNKKLFVNEDELKELNKILINRKILVAASTHAEDETVILDIIHQLKEKKLNIYPIVILRHPERRNEIGEVCQKMKLKYSFRSNSPIPNPDDDLYIVDSFGELGLFYSISNITFVGGSFKRGGHNLLEPAYFNNIIILGPDMTNFQNITEEMVKNKAAFQVKNPQELKEKIVFLLEESNQNIAREYIRNAKEYVINKEKILHNYINQIDKYFND